MPEGLRYAIFLKAEEDIGVGGHDRNQLALIGAETLFTTIVEVLVGVRKS